MTDQVIEYSYSRLIHVGICNHPETFERHRWPGTVERWRAEIAEPFWQGITAFTEADGLRVDCFTGSDKLLDSVGYDNEIAAAKLVRPNGREYDRVWLPGANALALIESDWGEALASARERRPYDFALEREVAEGEMRRSILGGAIRRPPGHPSRDRAGQRRGESGVRPPCSAELARKFWIRGASKAWKIRNSPDSAGWPGPILHEDIARALKETP